MTMPEPGLCSNCGRKLNGKGECLPCLVQAAFDRSLIEMESQVFGDFEIVRRDDGSFWELGRGAMGVTYRAQDKVLNRMVALKVIDPPTGESGGQMVRDRFLREARAAAAFRHPNVAGVFRFGTSKTGDQCYYAMELVEGETLETLVRRDGPVKVDAALEIAVQVTRALVAAASHGLVHRDLKPGNIMLTRTETGAQGLEVKVIDFGLAKAVTEEGQAVDLTRGGFVGTPAFASPEQFSGAAADARSDIYSLGVTLWYALTGDVPFPGKTIQEIRHNQSDLPLPVDKLTARKIPGQVIQLLRKILAVDPLQRPASARELMDALESCQVRLGLIPPRQSSGGRPGLKLAALLLALILAATPAYLFFRSWASKSAGAIAGTPKSIAILPFLDLSQSKDQEYLSDGITEQIINSLAQVHGLFVVARTTAFSFKNKNMDVRDVGRQLGVSHMLEGSVRQGPSRVRVMAQLIDVENGYHLWSETYDSSEKDLLSLQSNIATKVANALRLELHLDEATQLAKPVTQNPEAYDLYLRGRYLLNKRTTDSIQKGRALFEQAVAKDPRFALGHAGIADSYILLGKIGELTGDEAAARAWPEVSTALEQDDKLAEGYVSRATILTDFEWNWAIAEPDYRKAIELNPNSANAHHWFGRHLAQIGRFEEAVWEIETAAKLDPLSPFIRTSKGKILCAARRYDEAIEQCRAALDLETDFAAAYSILAQAYLHKGQYPEGIIAAQKYVDVSNGSGWAQLELAYSYAVAGNTDKVDQIVNDVIRRAVPFSPYDMATIHSARHDPDGAFHWLEKAIEQRSVDVIWIRVDPRLDQVRADPRFSEVLTRLVPRQNLVPPQK